MRLVCPRCLLSSAAAWGNRSLDRRIYRAGEPDAHRSRQRVTRDLLGRLGSSQPRR
jgi:hypothetical protein